MSDSDIDTELYSREVMDRYARRENCPTCKRDVWDCMRADYAERCGRELKATKRYLSTIKSQNKRFMAERPTDDALEIQKLKDEVELWKVKNKNLKRELEQIRGINPHMEPQIKIIELKNKVKELEDEIVRLKAF